ncbi:MarR family winged helix-turn-helix transcriptional regulator [Paenibacillus lautus]|uniref:MarR family winged helix-turn-helix transcriptional regulator n=1 Tax=Paenibacillus lautus TaxID=1401 RepID=UPI003D2C5ADD
MIFDPQYRKEKRTARISMALIRLSLALKKMMQAEREPLDLSPLQIHALLFAAFTRNDVATVGNFSITIGATHVTAVKVIQGLVKKGLIVKIPNPDDRRVTLLELTSNGKELVSKLENWGHSLEESLNSMSDQLLVNFELGLGSLLSSLEKRGHLVVAEPCLGCIHFHPNVGDPTAPHYCELIRKHISHEASLQECPEHTPSLAD